jgi:hypothetical protein
VSHQKLSQAKDTARRATITRSPSACRAPPIKLYFVHRTKLPPSALQVAYLPTLAIPAFSLQLDTFVDFLTSAISPCCIYTNHKKI